MNYYNPYFYAIPTPISTQKVGLFSRIFGKSGVTLSGILNGTQKALNFANQAIPLVKQVRPMFVNAKTMFKVMNEFKKAEKPKQNVKKQSNISSDDKQINTIDLNNTSNNDLVKNNNDDNTDGPTFFI